MNGNHEPLIFQIDHPNGSKRMKEELMKRWRIIMGAIWLQLFALITSAWAGGGEKASELVVVADTRMIGNPIMRYIADTYNTNLWLFAVWSVVLTALFGALLGFLMDWLISKSGLDLSSRKIIEH
jgi:ABC-type Fe3+ transport system permease subunit